jgi:hypothetical protein
MLQLDLSCGFKFAQFGVLFAAKETTVGEISVNQFSPVHAMAGVRGGAVG